MAGTTCIEWAGVRIVVCETMPAGEALLVGPPSEDSTRPNVVRIVNLGAPFSFPFPLRPCPPRPFGQR